MRTNPFAFVSMKGFRGHVKDKSVYLYAVLDAPLPQIEVSTSVAGPTKQTNPGHITKKFVLLKHDKITY